jgi:xylulokinase
MLACGRSAVPGLWHPYAYVGGGGLNLEWFREEIIGGHHAHGNGKVSFAELDAQAAKILIGEDSPFFIPHLGGRACPSQPELRGAWVGLNWSHTRADLYRAALEAVALEYAAYKRALLALYPKFRLTELRIAGGGEKSELWNQIKADVLGAPVRRIGASEGAPRGAAMLAGWGVGVLKNLPTAAKTWAPLGAKTRPNRLLAPHYSRRHAMYEQLIKRLGSLSYSSAEKDFAP